LQVRAARPASEESIMAERGARELLKRTFRGFVDDGCPQMAAALSYYTVFALPPLLILILTVVGLVMDPEQVQEALRGQVGSALGRDGAEQIATIVEQANRPEGRGPRALVGIVGLLLGATGAFLQLQSALNRAWDVEPDPEAGGIRQFLVKRLLSLGMILGLAFLLLVSLALSAAISMAGEAIGELVPGVSEALLHLLNLGLTLGVVTVLFAAMFRILPDARIAWRDVWVGGAVTAVLFVVGKFALGLYLGRSDPGEAFGAAGSLALLLVWIYYASMIVLLGAEFTQSWAAMHGEGITPEPGARLGGRSVDRSLDEARRRAEGTLDGARAGG
jgi:membrane protein